MHRTDVKIDTCWHDTVRLQMKRFSVYCFYDKDSIAGQYVFYYLNALKEISDYLFVVINGDIDETYKTGLQSIADRVDIRENYGFDAYAYKYALNECKNILSEYDELIFSNNSFYGPVYPLTDVFEHMESKNLPSANTSNIDFWGITLHPRINARINEKQKLPYINEHIQSYFLVFNRQVFLSKTFSDFFQNLPPIDNFLDAVVLFELELTRVLSEDGHFRYSSYVDPEKFPDCNCTIPYPYDLYRDGKTPFIKRKVFFEKYHEIISLNRGNQSRRLLDELKNSGSYPVELIWNDLLRTQRMSVLRENLHLNSIIDSSIPYSRCAEENKRKVALILYIYYEDQVENCLKDALKLVSLADVFVVCSRRETLKKAQELFSVRNFRKVEFILKQNKGRDLSSYLIDARFVFDQYDYVCYFHDKKSPQLANIYTVRDFYEHCIESILDSENTAVSIIREFEENPKLGLLVPPPLNWGPFYPSEYNLNPQNRELMHHLIDELHLNVPFDDYPVAPYGDFFWVRSAAIKPLFNKNWTYDDLPEEPIAVDGTILHALERIIPFCIQSAGYYTSWINSASSQKLYTDNCYYYARMFNQTMFKLFPFCDLTSMRIFLTQIERKQDNRQLEIKPDDNSANNRRISQIIADYDNTRRKYRKYFILNILSLGIIPKFRRRKLKIKKIINNQFKHG